MHKNLILIKVINTNKYYAIQIILNLIYKIIIKSVFKKSCIYLIGNGVKTDSNIVKYNYN